MPAKLYNPCDLATIPLRDLRVVILLVLELRQEGDGAALQLPSNNNLHARC